MTELLGRYRNGNYMTSIYADGTRIREVDSEYFHPDFAECVDIHISNKCERECYFCYEGCTPEGKSVDLKEYKTLFDSVHPFTELAINLNFPLDGSVEWFLRYMKKRHVIVNATINSLDFM